MSSLPPAPFSLKAGMSGLSPRIVLSVVASLLFLLAASSVNAASPSPSPLTREQVYAQAGMAQNWVAPMPSTSLQAAGSGMSGEGEKFLVQNWATTFHQIQIGGNDISFTGDPFANAPTATVASSPGASSAGSVGVGNSTTSPTQPQQQQVLKLDYPRGSYAPSIGPIPGGTHFYAKPFGDKTPFESMMVSYDVAFPNGFNWVLGGKLPGVYGGTPYDGCSGGVQSTGANCLTMRLMWRPSGSGEVYAYVPADPKSNFCKNSAVICNDQYGKSIGRGQIYFQAGNWTRMDMIMSLNKPAGNSNGTLQVYRNGALVIHLDDIPYRTSGMVGFQGLMFSSFFGGSDSTYASPVDTSVYFRNVQLSVGQPAALYQGTGGSIAAGDFSRLKGGTIVAIVVSLVSYLVWV
ncbi:hypothetical protein EMPS_10975 [Entomortierella parvispora]|uniref:Polysaccharide lyase 14 domain-containing protein n=1 Tax=Entomortierella parvispora TaxID=205924 RepID=A0A9P3HL24_9FUNG|nr:hypothetical protein EMPS_10975 [Entomortierella parvispora]